MKAIFINGSPRKNKNTFKMLESAMNGAKEAGAEVELIQLFDYEFTGCKSCFACKIKNSKTNGLCAIHDSLRPILEKNGGSGCDCHRQSRLLRYADRAGALTC